MPTERWSQAVTHRPPATFPPPGIYTRSAREIYLAMRDPAVSPNGLGSAIQMVRFFVNRAGRNIPERQRRNCIKAIEMLQLELAYLKQAQACNLKDEPEPVFPKPGPDRLIGGRYGYKDRKDR